MWPFKRRRTLVEHFEVPGVGCFRLVESDGYHWYAATLVHEGWPATEVIAHVDDERPDPHYVSRVQRHVSHVTETCHVMLLSVADELRNLMEAYDMDKPQDFSGLLDDLRPSSINVDIAEFGTSVSFNGRAEFDGLDLCLDLDDEGRVERVFFDG